MKTMQVGELVAGKFEVLRVLGEGGMGVVVSARHVELDRIVALKFMRDDIALSANAGERFMREARAAARLRGPHVAQVLDVGRLESGAPYIVMEYLEGCDLAQLLEKRGALPISEAVAYVLQACEAMAEAHAAGIVHRDLKPQNLFVTDRAEVKVLDFGISKAQLGDGVTKTHQAIGTPAYMAPEQMRSARTVDGRADIWSLGIILYQLLSNELPFVGDTYAETMLKALGSPVPPLASMRPDVPAPLVRVVERCLAKERDRRYPTIAALAQDLAPFAPAVATASLAAIAAAGRAKSVDLLPTVPPVHAQPTTLGAAASAALSAQARPATRWNLIAAAVAAVAVGVISTILATRRPDAAAPTAAPPADAPPAVRVEPKPVAVDEPAWAHELEHERALVEVRASPRAHTTSSSSTTSSSKTESKRDQESTSTSTETSTKTKTETPDSSRPVPEEIVVPE